MEYSMMEIDALKELVGINKDEDNGDQHVYGSALNPGSLGGKKKDELAKPNVKVEVKTFNRDAKGGATQESLKAYEEEQRKKKLQDEKTSIWTEEEVNIKQEELPDDRPQPKFDIKHKQHVGTEDVFLGLSDKDPSSMHCDSLLVEVWLPGAKVNQVQLDIQGQQIVVQSPFHVLKQFLPYPVNKDKGKAKFDSDKGILSVTLPVIKKTIFDEL
ncbi:hypothetical protein FGO68_gene4406 [Halteria grandinella]|uniref:PIH1D1/2/3 CS-like domain-containing protein n=1 Tax=Halteria grandinella TaxID=5974 RepID=A0A8J8NGI0_HALGN|nr:hypothetical protein FGO68_gene4406 [Halteria grandinella]